MVRELTAREVTAPVKPVDDPVTMPSKQPAAEDVDQHVPQALTAPSSRADKRPKDCRSGGLPRRCPAFPLGLADPHHGRNSPVATILTPKITAARSGSGRARPRPMKFGADRINARRAKFHIPEPPQHGRRGCYSLPWNLSPLSVDGFSPHFDRTLSCPCNNFKLAAGSSRQKGHHPPSRCTVPSSIAVAQSGRGWATA